MLILPTSLLLYHLGLFAAIAAAAELNFIDSVKRQLDDVQDFLDDAVDLPKAVAKKSIQDEEAIQAAENYEFEYLPSKDDVQQLDYALSEQLFGLDALASASHDDHHDPHHHHHHHHHHHKVGYSVGGPLVNIAQGAAAQAHNFEKNQPAAAAQAAYVAKNRLGQSAGLSAATAAAAFAGKQIIYRGLQQQAYNAHRALESEKLQLQQAQRAATAAAHAAEQATRQVQVITTALNAAQATSQHASAAAAAAAAELAAQTAMVGAAKTRLQTIEEQLHLARIDFEAAQAANFKAAAAAQLAQNNAAAAAAHAAEVANANRQHHEHGHGHHSGKLEAAEHLAEEADDEDGDHERHESVSASQVSNSPPTSASTTGKLLTEDGGRLLQSAPPDYSGPPTVTVASISTDELYDAYDSFPY